MQDCTGGWGPEGVGAHTLTRTPGRRTKGSPPGTPVLQTLLEKEKTPGSGPKGPRPPNCAGLYERRGQRGSPKGGPFMYILPPPLGQAQGGAPPSPSSPEDPATGKRTRVSGAWSPDPRPAAPDRLPGGARVPRRAPRAGSAAPSRQLGQHFALTLAPALGKLRGSAGAGADGGRPGLRGGGDTSPLPHGQKGGGFWRGGRKAAGRRGAEPAAAPTPQAARQVAPGPQAAGAARRMAPRRREPRAASRAPAPPPPPPARAASQQGLYFLRSARLDLAGPRQSCAAARC